MRMLPVPPSSTAAPTQQLHLPLDAPRLDHLDAKSRPTVVAILATLLLQAARPDRGSEVADDAP